MMLPSFPSPSPSPLDSDSDSENENESESESGLDSRGSPLPPPLSTTRRRQLVLVRTLRFLFLGLPGGLLLGMEGWTFVAASFLVAQMGTIPLATHEVMAAFSNFVFLSMPFAISVAVTIRTSQLLASNDAAKSRASAWLGLAASLLPIGASALLAFSTPETLGSVFTDDPDVLYRVKRAAPLLAGFQAAYGLQGVLQGVLRALARQRDAAMFTCASLWLVGIPSAYWLGFHTNPTLGFDGLWGGLVLGMGLLALVLLLLVLTVDWHRASREAAARSDLVPAGSVGATLPGSLSRGGFQLRPLSEEEEMDIVELVDIDLLQGSG
jgi:Na+-driven multidrug efflux pump